MDFMPLFTKGTGGPCCLLIGRYSHHMIFLPSGFYGEKCYGVHV